MDMNYIGYRVVSDNVQSSLLNFVESRGKLRISIIFFFSIRLLLFSGTPTTINIVLLLSFVLAAVEKGVVLDAFVVVGVEVVDDDDVVVVVVLYAGTIISSGICSNGMVLILRVTS